MKKNLVMFFIAILLVTIIVVLLNPQAGKNLNISSASNNIITVQSNIQSKDVVVDNKQTTSQKQIAAANVNTVQQVDTSLNTVDTVQGSAPNNTISREEYMQNIKERAKEKYARFLERKALQEQEKAAREAELDRQMQQAATTKQTTSAAYTPQIEIYDAPAQPAKKSTPASKTTQVKKQPTKTVQPVTASTTKTATTATKPQTTVKTSFSTQAKKQQQQKKLTSYEENILWNQWRADVCNKIGGNIAPKISKIAEFGSVYSFSFTVNNNRQISNISVKLRRGFENANSSQVIKLLENEIRTLNGNSILQFPEGTERTTVDVTSGITMTQKSKALDASDFNDTETVTKYKYE